MQRFEPRWIQGFQQEKIRADILVALNKCDNDIMDKWERDWLRVVEEGREPKRSLTDLFQNPWGRHSKSVYALGYLWALE
jgi:hypothetical protein